mmetsp:Transcript_24510/g.70913  ORF Transcript_24510/g.70913 Transcript_24510/m.70913 type:complete len:111 (+) Transcript_24510:313-645(+)
MTHDEEVRAAERIRDKKRQRLWAVGRIVLRLDDPAVQPGERNVDAGARGPPCRSKSDVCAICLEPKVGQCDGGYRVLLCGHSFHALCVDEWWLENGHSEITCPLCRITIA